MPTANDPLTLLLKQMEVADEEARLCEARESFPSFCEYVMIDDAGRSWDFAPHQYEWSALMDDPDILLLMIIAQRGSAKSTTLLARILYELGRNPNTCFKYVCANDNKAIDRLNFLRKNIIANERYHRVFPHVQPEELLEWTKHKATIQRSAGTGIQDASVECSSVDRGGTGGRCHILVLDDVIDSTTALQRPGTIARTKRMVEADWMSTLFPGGRVWAIGTFWSFDPPDLYVEYRHHPAWTTWIKPACETDAAGNLCEPVMWRAKFPLPVLETRRAQVGHDAFAQQYLLRGAVQPSNYFAQEHIEASKTVTCSLGEMPFEIVRAGIGFDPATALTAKTGSYGCIFVVGLGRCGRKVPLAIVRLKAEPIVLVESLLDQYRFWALDNGIPTSILVENNATQKSFQDLIAVLGERRGMDDLPIRGQFTGSNKWEAEGGLPALNAGLAQGKWVIPYAGDHTDAYHECGVCAWLWELEHWGKLRDARGRVPTTDTVMAWWLADAAVSDRTVIGEIPIVVMRETQTIECPAFRRAG